MSTCKSGKWPSRVSNGDTAAPAPQAQQGEPVAWLKEWVSVGYEGKETPLVRIDATPGCERWLERLNPRITPLIKAAPAPQVQEPTAWRTEAVKWIRRKAEDQRATNEQNPRHAEAYPSWGERVRQWHGLADELELEQNSPPFGLEPYQEPAPQVQPICKLFGTLPVYDTPAPQEKAREE